MPSKSKASTLLEVYFPLLRFLFNQSLSSIICLQVFVPEAKDAKWCSTARAVQNGMRNVFKEFPAVGQGRRQTGIVGENCVLILVRVIPIEEPRRLKRGDVGKTKPQSEKRTNPSHYSANICCAQGTRVGSVYANYSNIREL